MKFNQTEPDFYSMPRLEEQEQGSFSSSSSIDAHTVETQSTASSSTTGIVTLDHQSSSSPPLSSGNCNVYPPNTVTSIMMANHSRQSSMGSTETTSSQTNFINELNRSIQLNELAIVCSALCNLRKGTTM